MKPAHHTDSTARMEQESKVLEEGFASLLERLNIDCDTLDRYAEATDEDRRWVEARARYASSDAAMETPAGEYLSPAATVTPVIPELSVISMLWRRTYHNVGAGEYAIGDFLRQQGYPEEVAATADRYERLLCAALFVTSERTAHLIGQATVERYRQDERRRYGR